MSSVLRRNEKSDFEKIKIAKASTNKVACNLYYDSFGIEKIKIQNFDYNAKVGIDSYIDFEDVIRIANDCKIGKLFKDIKKCDDEKKKYSLGYKGSQSSAAYDGKPESRQITFAMSGEDRIFINMTRCEGIIDPENKTIKPNPNRDQSKDLKIGVPVSVEKFRSMFLYADAWIKAFLGREVPLLYDEAAEKRNEEKNATNN